MILKIFIIKKANKQSTIFFDRAKGENDSGLKWKIYDMA